MRTQTAFDSKYYVKPYGGDPEGYLAFAEEFMLRMMQEPASSGCKLYSVLDTINGVDMCGEVNMLSTENMHATYVEKNAAGEEKVITPTAHDQRTWQEGHKLRDGNLFSLLLAHIVKDNLVWMLTESARGDGYNA